ncbi:MAG: TonB-dependent receptor, partial [Bacteroidetes bacterium]
LQGRVKIDMIRLTGPNFTDLDNRLLSLWIVRYGLSEVAMFGPDGRNVHASEFLYRKNVLVVRGSFRPPTLVNMDMVKTANQQFRSDPKVDAHKTFLLTEITMDNLRATGELDEQDFLDRAILLCAMGQTVMISDCEEHQKLVAYLSDYKVQQLGIVLGVHPLLERLNDKYYQNMETRLLAAFGELFARHVRIYVYPAQQEGREELLTAQNLPVADGLKFLYQHLLDNKQIVDIEGYNPDILHIYSKNVLELIQAGEEGWEAMVPSRVAAIIKENYLFGYPTETVVFEY